MNHPRVPRRDVSIENPVIVASADRDHRAYASLGRSREHGGGLTAFLKNIQMSVRIDQVHIQLASRS